MMPFSTSYLTSQLAGELLLVRIYVMPLALAFGGPIQDARPGVQRIAPCKCTASAGQENQHSSELSRGQSVVASGRQLPL
jgi:hypothetical protein